MITHFYAFPMTYDWSQHAPKSYVVVSSPESYIDEEGVEIYLISETLVNTTQQVPEWAEFEVFPATPKVIFA